MSISQLINEIVSEWAYRINDGMPDVKNPTHIKELGIVLSEMGLTSVKKQIINHLTEADENKFTNPVLNKKITYKNTKGEDAEGVVGDLLRQPKDSPARKAAERMLPPEGSPERDEINKDLGGEGQPQKPEDEKGKESGEAEKEKQQQAQAMFDPKNDPAMAARLDKEKEIQAQLAADTEKQKATPETPANQKTNKELAKAAGFDNVGSWYNDLNKKAMSDDPEVSSQAQKDLDTYEKNKVKDASAAKTGPEGGPDAEPPTQEPDRPDTTPPTDGDTTEEKPKNVDKYGFEKKGSKSLKHPNLFGAGGKFYSTQKNGFPEFEEDENGKLIPIDKESQQDWKTKKLNPLTVSLLKREDRKFYQEISDREDVDGNKLDSEVTDNGSMIIGIEHGENNQSTQNLIDKLNELPSDSKIMFVGEGGMSKDANGNIEFAGEQSEIRDAIKGKFKNSAESSWDENANIADDNSPVFDEVSKSVGGSKSKSKAAIWSNMVGQGDDLNADDYLDDEGKAWLVDQAKKGGSKEFDGDVNWANLSDAQKKDLYELNFRDDQNYGETEISKAQEAYNEFRQKELDRKIKEAEEQGYRVIAPVGNSHVDMWRKRNRPEEKDSSSEKPEEPKTEPEQPSAEKPEQPKPDVSIPGEKPGTIVKKSDGKPDVTLPSKKAEPTAKKPSDAEKPEDKKDDEEDIKKEKPGQEATSSSGKKIYSVGGGYYSDKPNGPAKYVRTEWVVDLAFSDILTEDVFSLFEKTISATLANGKKITVQELPPRAVKKATQKAKAAAASYKEPEQKPQAPKGETPSTDKKVAPQPPVPPKKAATPPPPPPPPPTRKEEPAEPGNPKGEYKSDPKLEPKVDDKGNVAGTDIPAQNEENPNPKFVNKVSTKLDDFYKDVLDEEERAQKAVIEKMKAEGKLPADFKEVHPLPFGFKHPALKDNPELQKEFSAAVKDENKPPHWDLCKVSIPGTNKFCDENIGIPRDKMPQLGGKPKPGSEGEAKAKRIADQNVRKKMGLPNDGEIPADKKQEYDDLYAKENTQHVNVEKEFEDYLKSEGINVSDPVEVPASSLKATQSELVGEQIVGMVNSLEQDPNNPFITAPIMVTRDGYVIDGHHRWATIQAYNMKHTPPNGDKEPIKMKVRVVDEDIETHIPRANAFAEKMGIETMSGKGKKKDEPKPATSTKPSTLSRIKEKLKNWNKKEKEYFNMGYHKPGSDARKTFSERLKDKASGAWKAVKDGFKNEVEEFKAAGSGVKNFFSGKPLSKHEQKALKAVGIKIAVTALTGAALGGLSYGAAGFAKHVAIEFIPHVVGETILKGAGRAAIFADADGEAEMDAQFVKFAEMIADGLENMKISPEQMEKMIDSYNKKKEEDTMKKEISVIDEIILEILNEKNPIQKADDVLNQTVKNPETEKDIKVSSALKYKNSQNKGQIQAYQAAVGLLKKAGISGDDLGATKQIPKEIPGQSLGFRKTKEKELEPTPTATKPTKGSRIIGGKDKTLAKVDTLKSKEFTQKQIPDDSKFSEKNKKFQVGPPPQPYKLPKEMYAGVKVPPRHLKALERMMNTKFSNETAKWSHFSDLPGGAGQISAQAGELMTMIGTTLDDKQAEVFYKSLIEHEQKQIEANPDLKIEGKRIVTKSWIQAAMNNRKAIRNRLAKEYPGAVIEAGSWDTEGEVEAMGLKDYKKNKGFSTDAYFKIKNKDGQQILDEVSLKKSTAVNFLNSGTGKLVEWDSNISDEINPNVYQKNQREALGTFGSNNIKKLKNAVAKDTEFQAIVKSKKIDLETAISKLKSGKGSRDINKVVLSAITTLAKKGDKGAIKYLQQVQDTHKKHQKDVITALGSNPKLKQGMLASIREEFPLKAVGEGEESMAIGPNSLDRAVLKNIFDTSDFNEIKEGLFAVTNEEPPYLAYKAGKKGRVIPIATIGVREDGVGYGGQIKFEMQLDRRFAKILEAANKNIYG